MESCIHVPQMEHLWLNDDRKMCFKLEQKQTNGQVLHPQNDSSQGVCAMNLESPACNMSERLKLCPRHAWSLHLWGHVLDMEVECEDFFGFDLNFRKGDFKIGQDIWELNSLTNP